MADNDDYNGGNPNRDEEPKVRVRTRSRPSASVQDEGRKKRSFNFRNPPEEYRFRPGQSGNPSGRPKKRKTTSEIAAEELDKIVKGKENGKDVSMTKKRLIIVGLINTAAKGDRKAAEFVLLRLDSPSNDLELIDADIELGEIEQAVLDEVRARVKARTEDPEDPDDAQA